MIFITVGTHEQPFNRLIKEINNLLEKEFIKEEVFMQVGYNYDIVPICKHKKILSKSEFDSFMEKARIIITHGGLSIIESLMINKIPIVVPRQKIFGEHVDDHQVISTRKFEKEKRIIAVYNIDKLGGKILDYKNESSKLKVTENISEEIENSSKIFSMKLDRLCQDLINSKT